MLSHSAYDLIDLFDGFLIDAYGVLIQSSGPLPGAAEFVRELRKRGKKLRIVTNDASRTAEACVAFYAAKGVDVSPEEVISAGLTIAPALARAGLRSPVCAVLGTDDTRELVRRAGGRVDAISADTHYDAVIVGDDSGFDTLPTMNALLSSIHRSVLAGRTPLLLLANPDLLYPIADRAFGFTSGSLAKLLEVGLERLHREKAPKFTVLGKPETFIFETALESMGLAKERAVMIGDQLETDIAGAKRAGLKAALVTTGVAHARQSFETAPDYIVQGLQRPVSK